MQQATLPIPAKLSLWNLIFLNIAIVASLQQIPSTAIYGPAVLSLFALGALCFLLPAILLTIFFTERFQKNGGSYLWVSAAFGKPWGFFVVCCQWLCNLIWYPTIFSLIAAIMAYLVHPQLVDNKYYILIIQISVFWAITLLNFFGVQISTWFSDNCSLLGILLPTLVAIGLAITYLMRGNPAQVTFGLRDFLPTVSHWREMAYMIQVIVSLVGIEMSAVHAGDVSQPQRTYKRSLWIAGALTLFLLAGTSLAISIVIPSQKISIVSGLIDAFVDFFAILNIPHVLDMLLLLILLGTLGTVAAWMLSSTRGMQIGSAYCQMPLFLQKTNRFGAPIGILILECVIFTVAVILFYLMPSVNAGFWFLIIVASLGTLVYYIVLFSAALHVALKEKVKSWPFVFFMCLGIFTCLVAISLGFIPPEGQVEIRHPLYFALELMLGLASILLAPFIFYIFRKTWDES